MLSHLKLSPFSVRFSAIIINVLLFASPVSANDDTSSDNKQETSITSIFGAQTDITVGLGVGTDHRYMGGKSERLIVWPVITVRRGLFFADSIRGAGAEWQSQYGFYIADAINYDVGRSSTTSVFRPGSGNLSGMGDVEKTLTNTVTIAQGLAPWVSIISQVETALNGSQRGDQYLLGIESTCSFLTTENLTLDVVAKWGDGRYNQTYFGVTATQSNHTGYSVFTPDSGIYAYLVSGIWKHSIDKNWSAQVIISGTRYTSRVTNSPIVDSKFGVTTFISLNYSF